MSEFDLRSDWTVTLLKGYSYENGRNHIKLRDMTRPEVLGWIREQGLTCYKMEKNED